MPVPSSMSDLSTTAATNSPAGSESPTQGDDFLRAIQSIVRHTNYKGSDIASATTTDIGAATGEFVDITGTTTITGLGTVAAGIVRTVRFTGALTLTHNATSLILPSSANITTANGDVAVFRSLGSGNWKCISYVKQDGTAIVTGLASYLPLSGGTLSGALTLNAGATFASSNLTFSGTSNRIIGDFSNATISNRVAFKTNTTNGNTSVGAIPDGSSVISNFTAYGSSDPTNSSTALVSIIGGSETRFVSGIMGSGTYLPMTFYTNGSENLRITTSGGFSFGATGTAYGTSGQVLTSNGNAPPSWNSITAGYTLGTPIATTSGSAVDFGSLPAGIKQIIIMGTGVSFTAGSVTYGVRLGTGGTPQTTGYASSYQTGSTSTSSTSNYILWTTGAGGASNTLSFNITCTLQDASTNTWVMSGTGVSDTGSIFIFYGSVSLSGTLDIVRLYGGTFDAGKVNIAYI